MTTSGPSTVSPSSGMDIRELVELDKVIKSLRGKSVEQIAKICSELDPAFVQAIMDRILDRVPKERRSMVKAAIESYARGWRPKTRDELYDYISHQTGFKIPRKGVCQGHCAPFDFLADIVLEEGNPDKLAIGNRGSGKTLIIGVAHAVNWKCKPKHKGATVGAVQAQAMRCYGYFKEVVSSNSAFLANTNKGKVLMSGTGSKIKSSVEVLTGSISGVNSPHPHLAHLDEVELLRPGVYEESLNMAQASHGWVAQNVLTSSWKKPSGLVTQLVKENEEARIAGNQEPYQEYRWCTWETTEPCPHDCTNCPFADVVRGEWQDGSPRTFESACKSGSPEPGFGKLKFTDGFVSLTDAVARFRKLSRRMWDSQQESKRPTSEGLVYSEFDHDRHVIRNYEPDPDHGPIYLGMDFGGTNPHACVFIQKLNYEIELPSWQRLYEGSYVIFDEVYISRVGNVEYGRLINRKIDDWTEKYPDFRSAIENRYRDPAAKAAAMDFRNLPNIGQGSEFRAIETTHRKTPVEDSIALVRDIIDGDSLYIDERAENVLDEMGSYSENPRTHAPVKEDDHAMDAMRYALWNLHVEHRRASAYERANSTVPQSGQRPRSVRHSKDAFAANTTDYQGSLDSDGKWTWDPEEAGKLPVETGQVTGVQSSGPRSAGANRRRFQP